MRFAVMTGIAVGGTIAVRSVFARKNYFYPDLPKGYQISQYDRPLCSGGTVEIHVGGAWKRIGLVRIHLEEDAGKSLHPEGRQGVNTTLVDLNALHNSCGEISVPVSSAMVWIVLENSIWSRLGRSRPCSACMM